MYLEKSKHLIIQKGFITSWRSCFGVPRPLLSPALKLAGQRDDVPCAWVHISISLYHQMIYSLVVSSPSNLNDLCRRCRDCTVRKVVCFWRTGNDDQKEWMGSSNFFQKISVISRPCNLFSRQKISNSNSQFQMWLHNSYNWTHYIHKSQTT